MAGILDWLGSGLLPQFFPEQMARDIRPRADTPLFDIAPSQGANGWQLNFGRPGSLTGDTFDQRFGGMQPPAQPQAMPSPQMQPPQQAQQAFNMPTSTYTFGGQMVPAFGQPEDPSIPQNAQPTAGRGMAPVPVNAPQSQAPSYQSELLNNAPSTAADNYFKFFDRFRPDYADRREATKAQSETARGLYEIYRQQNMTPNEAAARAVIEARNPEVMKERMKPYTGMEQRIANQPNGPQGGGAMQQYTDFIGQKTTAEELAKKRSDAQSTRETLQLELPGLTADATEHLRQVEALRNHPGRKGNPFWHSKLGGYVPDSAIPGNTDAGDAVNRLNGIKGGAFLEAFKGLKGGGQITEIEGKKATDAIARMNRATSEAEFNSALDDYSGAIKRGVDKLNATAGLPPPGGFKGNDGWQTLPGGVKIRPKQ